jgi:hypothetical protein
LPKLGTHSFVYSKPPEPARPDYLVLLNNDTVVTDSWLNQLISLAGTSPAVGLVGPTAGQAARLLDGVGNAQIGRRARDSDRGRGVGDDSTPSRRDSSPANTSAGRTHEAGVDCLPAAVRPARCRYRLRQVDAMHASSTAGRRSS